MINLNMNLDYKTIVQYGLIAFLGGVCRVLYKEKYKDSWKEVAFRIVTGGLISSFTGIVVFFLLASYMPEKPMVIAALVGASGWAGPAVLDTIARVLKASIIEIINYK